MSSPSAPHPGPPISRRIVLPPIQITRSSTELVCTNVPHGKILAPFPFAFGIHFFSRPPSAVDPEDASYPQSFLICPSVSPFPLLPSLSTHPPPSGVASDCRSPSASAATPPHPPKTHNLTPTHWSRHLAFGALEARERSEDFLALRVVRFPPNGPPFKGVGKYFGVFFFFTTAFRRETSGIQVVFFFFFFRVAFASTSLGRKMTTLLRPPQVTGPISRFFFFFFPSRGHPSYPVFRFPLKKLVFSPSFLFPLDPGCALLLSFMPNYCCCFGTPGSFPPGFHPIFFVCERLFFSFNLRLFRHSPRGACGTTQSYFGYVSTHARVLGVCSSDCFLVLTDHPST